MKQAMVMVAVVICALFASRAEAQFFADVSGGIGVIGEIDDTTGLYAFTCSSSGNIEQIGGVYPDYGIKMYVTPPGTTSRTYLIDDVFPGLASWAECGEIQNSVQGLYHFCVEVWTQNSNGNWSMRDTDQVSIHTDDIDAEYGGGEY